MKKGNPNHSQKVSDEQIRDLHSENLRLIEISRRLKITPGAVSYRLTKMGLHSNRTPKAERRVIKGYNLKPNAIKKVSAMAEKSGKLKGEIVECAIDLYFKKFNGLKI